MKIKQSKVTKRVCKELEFDPKRISKLTVYYRPNQIKAWKGWTEYTPRTIDLWFNGNACSNKTEEGIHIRTLNHYETRLTATAHEIAHLKQGPGSEVASLLAERQVLKAHRRNPFRFLKAFLLRPDWR